MYGSKESVAWTRRYCDETEWDMASFDGFLLLCLDIISSLLAQFYYYVLVVYA